MPSAELIAVAARLATNGPLATSFADGEEVEGERIVGLLTEGDAEVLAPGDLIGSKEAVELLGVDKRTLARWRSQNYLPEPFQTLASGPVWLRHTLERFKAEHASSADAAGRRPLRNGAE